MDNVKFMPGKDIFESSCITLCNPVNLVGVMGRGLALQFHRRYPGLLKDYTTALNLGWLRWGTVWPFWYEKAPRNILHCPTKLHYQEPSPPQLVESTIQAIGTYCRLKETPRIAIPMLGCGLGGLEWPNVRRLLLQEARRTPATKFQLYGPPPRHSR